MSLYQPIDHWQMPSNTLSDSVSAMAPDGRQGNEGLVLWLGQMADNNATITHLATVPDRWIEKHPKFLRVAPAALNALVDFSEPLGISLIGQIHSHPGTFVDLSATDRSFGISAPYYLSVVAPYYAQRPNTAWQECGIHQYLPGIGFRRLASSEVLERIRVLANSRAVAISLGENHHD